MDIPGFPSQNVAAPQVGGALAPTAYIKFYVEQQLAAYWCWAAVATSVARFLDPTSTLIQCQVATAVYVPPSGSPPCDCCDASSATACNVEAALDTALEATGNYAGMENAGNAAGIVQQISDGNPVCLRVQWPPNEGNGGHFIGVNGTASGTDGQIYLSITDPANAPGSYSVSDLLNGGYTDDYHGTWTHTYYTQKAS